MRDGPGYLPLYVDDYEAATAHLTIEEDGAYMRLLRLCWRQADGTIPDDDEWIMRRLRVDAATFERAVRPVLAEFFQRRRKRVFQKRLSAELERVRVLKSVRKSSGSKGGKAAHFGKYMENMEKDASKPQAKNEQTSSIARVPDQTRPDQIREEDTTAAATAQAREANSVPEPERPVAQIVAIPGGRAAGLDATLDALTDLVSHRSPGGIGPAAWLNPGARIIAAKWITDLGLTHGEVMQVARAQIARHGKPPGKPEWWNGPMQAMAAAKAAPALSPSPPAAAAPPMHAAADVTNVRTILARQREARIARGEEA